MELSAFFQKNPKAALAFSGGVDSAYLLYAAAQHGAQICAYFVKTAFQPLFELEDAKRLAQQFGIPMKVLELDILQDDVVTNNLADRCYHCKCRIFSAILQAAKEDGFALVLDGTNASDDALDRPGMRALQELSVRSPLRECGLTKEQIRLLSKEAGLFTWDKPAYACLATRIPAGTRITEELLCRTERCEDFLMELGFSDFRVRLMGDHAMLQVRQSQIPFLLTHRQTILTELQKYYSGVLLDLEVRHE